MRNYCRVKSQIAEAWIGLRSVADGHEFTDYSDTAVLSTIVNHCPLYDEIEITILVCGTHELGDSRNCRLLPGSIEGRI